MKANILKFTVLLLMLVGSYSACKEQERCDSFVQIGKGVLSGSEGVSQQNIIISTQEEWENLKTTMNLVNEETLHFSETDVDFNTYQIVAVFGEVYSHGSWSISVECVLEYTDRIVVTVAVQNHDKGASPQWVTQPYHIVKIPASTKKIEFE